MLLATALMRLVVSALLCLPLFALGGCIDHPESPALPDEPDTFGTPNNNQTPSPQDPGTETPAPPAKPTALGVIKEEVYVLMKDWNDEGFMCTGTLVAKNIVLTAAHCLTDSEFKSWEIVAPFADGQPRVNAINPNFMGWNWENDPSQPDIGILWLEQDIELPTYAEFTDVSERAEKGEALEASVVVRTDQKAESTFKSVDALKVTSTTERGYTHGLGTPYFSHGGDSGAGLFLIEDGKVTHKLIGVERNPETDQNLDHFTRVDSDFLGWFHDNTGE